MSVNGILSYGEGPLRYDIAVRTDRTRIRYPVGMSWLAGGTLRLSGNSNAATLSGRVTVERLLMAEGFDLGSVVGSSSESISGPSTSSAFLRNLQFDIQADLAPNARFEWTSATFQTEATMQVRGTWEHPILLGHLHLLNGDMQFRGNRYKLSRGDVNFANPFRLDPVINIEAATTIRQYEVTVNFSGPASHLTMSYRSDPPLPSSDIIALLALGQTGAESQLRGLSSGQTSQSGANTLLSEAISSQLGGRIQRLFGVSHFSLDPFLSNTAAGGATNSARVTISQQVSQNLIITYVTNITSTQQQIIQIEYAVRKDLSIVALRDQNGTFGIDVVHTMRFK
jgi:translocation and assembly module TamB